MKTLALLLALVAAGCATRSPFDLAVGDVRRTYPEAHVALQTQVNVGYFTRGLALSALAMAGRGDEDLRQVRGLVRAMQGARIRRYALTGLDSATFAARPFRFAPAGFEPVARVRSDGDRMWVMGRPSGRGRPGTVLVGVFSPHELLMVEVTGNYERMLAAVQDGVARHAAQR